MPLSAGVAGTYAGAVAWQKTLPERTGSPDLPWALVEDAAAAGLAAAAVRAPAATPPWWRRLPLIGATR